LQQTTISNENETILRDFDCRIVVKLLFLCSSEVVSVGLFVQSAYGAHAIYNLFSSNLLRLRNVVIRNRIPYEQGIHVFAQPIIGPSGNLEAYSLAVTGTTSLAFAEGVPNSGDTRELYRSTKLLYIPAYQLNLTVAEMVRQLAREQF
jgi:hypothetical protein